MNNAYGEFKSITDEYYRTGLMPDINVFIDLLRKYGYKLRQDDGDLNHATFSVPESKKDALVLGLRYLKKNGTWTEDHFLFHKDKAIAPHYRGKMERILSEYKGTHKKQGGFY